MDNIKPDISYDDFDKLDIRVGTIRAAEAVPKSKKLLKLQIYFGEVIGFRTILAGISATYLTPDSLVGTQVMAVLNLSPREMFGIVSYGMLLAAPTVTGLVSLGQCPGCPDGEAVG